MRRHSLTAAVVAVAALATAGPAQALSLPTGPTSLPSVAPVISGTPEPGQTLTCSPGTVYPTGTTLAYSWQRDVLTTVGTASPQYLVSSADVGHALTCTVVASLIGLLPVTTVSLPVTVGAAPAGLAPVDVGLPSISGTAQEGQTLTCNPGTWLNSPTQYSYSWLRGATQIATGSAYALTASDVGQAITCAVTASNASGSSLAAVSLPVIPIAGPTPGSSGAGSGSGAGGTSTGTGGSNTSSGSGGSTKTSRTPAPRVIAFAVTPRRLVELVRHGRTTSHGTSFRYRLDRAASLYILIERRVSGRWVKVKAIVLRGTRAGAARRGFNGRVGRRLLAAGRYRAVVAALGPGGWSNQRSAAFTVVRKRARK